MIRYSAILVFLFTTLASSNCKKKSTNNHDISQITDKVWINSYEEDSIGYKAYRPDSYNFPPSRGRTGFKIQKDGTFIYYGIAPADGTEKHTGKWELVGEKGIKVTFNQIKRQELKWEIIKIGEGIIWIKEN